ncbi:MAG: mechanosensitive ion channel [Candidatus Promineifilaceae bacterium]|nr:mechanosensitive ion channel [Candidatus Promineifilaceae bacterium]
MNDNNPNQGESLFESISDQLDVLLAIISRPVVQRQIVVILLIFLLAWLLPESVRRWRRRRRSAAQAPGVGTESTRKRWLASIYYLVTPLLVLAMLTISGWIFAFLGYPHGLLSDLNNLILIWLVYRLVMTALFGRFGEAAGAYQTRIVTPIFLFLLAIQFLSVIPGSTTFTNSMIHFGTISFSLSSLVGALIVLYVFIIVAWIVKQMMVHTLPRRLDAQPGVIESVATLTRYALVAVGIILSLGFLGLNFTSLAIIAGGLSVGIGIGLQDLVSNFVSGLVLLFEQSLRPGDIIELNGRISRVEKVSLRSTIVRTRTNEELIVPNNSFTADQVKNFTKSERLVRVIVPFGVSYKSDPELVRTIATEVGLTHPLVLPLPPPELLFQGYNESSLDFNLQVSTNEPELTFRIRSDLYYALWKKLAENNIEIPFPQRDLNLGDGWEDFTAGLQPGRGTLS